MLNLTIQSPSRGRNGDDAQSYTDWQSEWSDALIGRDHFKAASVHSSGYIHRTDQLPTHWLADYHATADHPHSFVVISWETPIAWIDSDYNWVIPAHTYSQSTTRAQRRLMSALDWVARGYRFDPLPQFATNR